MQYRVLADESRHYFELEAKRSRFIAVLQRVEQETAVPALVADLRREFRDAGHFGTAYFLGSHREIESSNDDGEPAGTAGAPMLEVLRHRPTAEEQGALSVVSALVIRYSGGTRLETGGLSRAGYLFGETHYGDQATLEFAFETGAATAQQLRQAVAAIDRMVTGSSELRQVGDRWIDG